MSAVIAVLLILVFLVFPFIPVVSNAVSDINASAKEKKNKEDEAKAKQYIIANSPLLKDLKTLNAQYTFYQLNTVYYFDYVLKSRREYDNFIPYEAFCDLCVSREKEFDEG